MKPETLRDFFSSAEVFNKEEWILKYQISTVLIVSFFFGLGVLPFSFVRLAEGNILVGISQLILSAYLFIGFYRLKYDKSFYRTYSIGFMLLFYIYTAIIFFYVPQNHLNILWVISAPILVFFFLNRSGGTVMFVLVILFIVYLVASGYDYTVAEYITLIGSFFITTFVMYTYEKVKEAEKIRLTLYNQVLEKDVALKTEDLLRLNEHLEHRVEEELAKRLSQEQMLLRQYRMANMGEMIDSIAHQWRQPLMHINALILNMDSHLDRQPLDAPYLQGKLDEVVDLTAHMSQTISDFRNLFKTEKESGTFAVEALVHEVEKLMRNALMPIHLRLRSHPHILLSESKNELLQVIVTILSNAIEAFEKKSSTEKIIQIDITQDDDHVTIRISDNAGGIPHKVLDKIFDPYFSTKHQTGGTGLGLYISKIIIEENMHGTLRARNKEHGACFEITLPRSPRDTS